jgi:hypothetical protein
MVRRVEQQQQRAEGKQQRSHIDDLIAQLAQEDFAQLPAEAQALIRQGVSNLRTSERQVLSEHLLKYWAQKRARDERGRSLWARFRAQIEGLFGQVQTFVVAEKAPTKFSTPDLGQGENLELWRQRMLRIIGSWRKGRRVDVTRRLSDDGALTLYFDDFGDLDKPETFAARISKRGELFSVEYRPGKGEIERVVGDQGRQQLRAFFQLLSEHDRGQRPLFDRFVRRLDRGERNVVVNMPTKH